MGYEGAAGISFIVPAYNEEAMIEATLKNLLNVLSGMGMPYEVILVNDGSSDRTLERARAVPGIVTVSHPINTGYGKSLKTGIKKARYRWIGITDADGTYPIHAIPELVVKMEQGYDMVIAHRENLKEHDSYAKRIFRGIFQWVIKILIHKKIEDPNSGLRIFSKSLAMKYFPFLCDTFSFTTSLTVLAYGDGAFVAHIPIQYNVRTGKSKVKHFRDSLLTIQYIVQGITYYNPIRFFVILAGLFVLLVGFPAMVIAVFKMHTLSLYYMLFGLLVTLLIALGILGDIVRVSALKGRSDIEE